MQYDQLNLQSKIESAVEERWELLRLAKFTGNTPEELNLMKTLWTHGFMEGAEAAVKLSQEMFETVHKSSQN
jgi:hypothetical protein